MKLKESEHDIQAAFFQWIRLAYPDVIAFAIPNQMRPEQVGRKKKEGMLAGVPDVFIALGDAHGYGLHGLDHNGLFLEFKSATGKMREEQIDVARRLLNARYAVGEVHSLAEAQEIVHAYFAGSWP